MKTATVNVRVADLPKLQPFLAAVRDLVIALAKCKNLPPEVTVAADHLRREIADLGGRDIGPPPS